MSELMQGQCLCGAVTITAVKCEALEVCHCGMCRQWSGGPLLVVHCGLGTEIKGQEFVAVYDSSEWAQRGFCKQCGTHLFYQLKQSNEYEVPVGLFKDSVAFTMHKQIFIDVKPNYYAFANDTPCMTEAEVFAEYAPK